tara:strand:- start:4351 stop:5031 length:681 start_codon:yes stop_codon:yes gene_type:complete
MIDEVEVTAMAPGSLPFSFYDVGGPNFGTDLSQGIGSFDPGKYIESYMNSPFATQVTEKYKESKAPTHAPAVPPAETGRFGGTFGPKLKGFFKKLAEIHPATRTPMFAFNMIKGLKNSKDPKAFMQGMLQKLAMRKVMGNFGMSSMQRQGIGSLMNVARGRQNWQQGLGGFATNAAFSQMMPNILKQAHQAGGMNGVYAAMAALQMARQRAQQGVSRGLAGPGGGG